jgi:hypothetical protein
MALESFNAYHSYLDTMEALNDAECGRLFRALLEYSATGAAPELRGNERFVFPGMRSQIDRDIEKYNAKCARNRENGEKGGGHSPPNAPERPRTPPKDKDKDKDKEKDKDKDISFPPNGVKDNAHAHRPTVEEVAAYCRERGNSVDAERFVDFYASKGWKVGNQPMKDWKACVRTWERREDKPKQTGRFATPDYDAMEDLPC